MERIPELRRRAADLAYYGRHREAVRIYEQILKSPAPDGEIALRLGTLRRKLGDLSGARAAFDRAADLFGVVGRFAQASAAEQLVAHLTREIRRERRSSATPAE